MAGRVSTVAVVPVKSLAAAKSRLARELNEDDRAAVSLDMLRSVLGQVRQTPGIDAWAIVSADDRALALAQDLGGAGIPERQAILVPPYGRLAQGGLERAPAPAPGLNAALDLGRLWASNMDAEALLIVPSDLPLVRSNDLAELLQLAAQEQADVVIAPSKDGGTNALLLRPPHAIPFRFGAGSAQRHLAEAARLGLQARLFHRETLAFDVDTPDDFSCYLAVEEGLAQLDQALALIPR